MFAIVSHNGNQHKVEVNKEYEIDLLPSNDSKEIVFSDVLLLAQEDEILVGTPVVPGVSVKAEILGNTVGEKVRIFKFEAKKRYKRANGHRQKYTKIKVLEIKNEK